ncbi:MAG: DUF4430 domain-containing protein [Anaerofustis stercorihominis]|nr:DUF4430 domain-containing protein [Anaerofustis stercorihominis]
MVSCTIKITCSSILDNMDKLEAGKDAYVPSDGVILSTKTFEVEEGTCVFDVLKKACNKYGIQLEYSWTPGYNSNYVEGINHIYEFDCGETSGWKYKVNGWYPNYGSSQYEIEDGDTIVWVYTCDL